MSRVESLPNRTKPRINHRAGVSSRSRARSSSHLGAYKVFVFAQIPSHRILQRLLQRPHGRLFQVCAADDVREQSRDLALRVRHRVVFVRVHGARAGVTPARRWVSADCELFSNREITRSVDARGLFAHTTDAARFLKTRRRSSDGWTIRGRRSVRRRARASRATTGKRTRTKGDARDGSTRGTMRLTFYTKMGGRLTPRRGGTKGRTRSAVVFVFVVGRLLRDVSHKTLKKSNQC